jgi:phosphotransferase system enzyme I (PtsI)
MELLQGISASPGIVSGIVKKLTTTSEVLIPSFSISNVDLEKERLLKAIDEAKLSLELAKRKMARKLSSEQLEIYDAHISILEDPELLNQTIDKITIERCNCAYAFNCVSQDFQDQLLQLNDEYLSARAHDLQEVALRVLLNLSGKELEAIQIHEEVILVCDRLTTHQLSLLDTSQIKAIVTAGGGTTDHVAIISKAIGIPLIVAVGDGIEGIESGDVVIVDGNTGQVISNANETVLKRYEEQILHQKELDQIARENSGKKVQTKSGATIKIYANVGDLRDVEDAIKFGAEGIGLMRTELTFSGAFEAPDESLHYDHYKSVLERMKGKETVIRLIDFGSDKQVPFVSQEAEENPALGVRALRLGFRFYDTLLAPQIRALLRLSTSFDLHILCPMIASIDDFRQVKAAFRKEAVHLSAKGFEVNPDVPLGIMVEIPYVAIFPELYVDEVDFFSFGTNDLSQFLMAADRSNSAVSQYLNQAKEGVIKLIQKTVDVAHAKGKWVGVCGELASDKSLIKEFLRIKVDEISMPPYLIPGIKEHIRKLE